DEVARAVDGVDDPAEAGRARPVAVLLAEEAVVGERPAQGGADGLLGLAVGDGDGALVLLPLDGQLGVEVAERQPAGLAGGLLGGLVAGAPLRIHERPPFRRVRRGGRSPFLRSKASAQASSAE